MKTLIVAILLLLSAPCWAQDPGRDAAGQPFWMGPNPEIRRLWPGGGYIEYTKTPSPAYETRIIPEAELEKWLNDGWELVKVYTVQESKKMNLPEAGTWPVNKAIIRRAKP